MLLPRITRCHTRRALGVVERHRRQPRRGATHGLSIGPGTAPDLLCIAAGRLSRARRYTAALRALRGWPVPCSRDRFSNGAVQPHEALLRILFASGRDYLPDRVDGAILSIHALLEQLQARGHEVEVLAGVNTRSRVGMTVYRARRLLTLRRVAGWSDRRNGYVTFRMWDTLIPDLLRQRIAARRPDLVITQLERSQEIARTATELGVPVILYVMDAEFNWDEGGSLDDGRLLLLSCSHFVAGRVKERFGIESPVLYLIIEPSRYQAPRPAPRRFVTLVNPVPRKGVDIAIEVAKLLPHRKFLFQESWPLTPAEREDLDLRLKTLPNVTLRAPTLDMRQVYAETAVLVVPSQWEEAFGRVIIEAQVNGIPVVASRRGGIPEALRGGGRLLDATDPPELWAEATEAIVSDPAEYAALREAALANAHEPHLDARVITDQFLEIAGAHVARAVV